MFEKMPHSRHLLRPVPPLFIVLAIYLLDLP
jgi:hypothetical protein